MHPYFNQEEQRIWNKTHGIVTESWSPLGNGGIFLTNEKIQQIAKVHEKSVSQIILRWHIQLGAIPIPKAASIKHQCDNLDIFDFELSEEEMKVISKLTIETGRINNQDPKVYEEF